MRTEWSVDRTTVPEGETLTATLTVRGATNPHEIVRPDLTKLPEFARRFRVGDVPGKPVPPDAKEVSFAYRLRPRNRDVDRVPSLDFFYHNPAVKTGDPFMNARAKGVDITVTAAAAKVKPPPVPLDAPEHLFDVATGPRVLGREPFTPGPWAWAALFAVGPLAALGWYVGWRRVFPDAARLARIRRSRAARRAVDAVRRAHRSADPPAAVAAAVAGYLRARFPLPPGAETPTEIGDGLRAAGLPADDAEAAAVFFRRCDAARFGPAGDGPVSLADEAEALVARLEAVE